MSTAAFRTFRNKAKQIHSCLFRLSPWSMGCCPSQETILTPRSFPVYILGEIVLKVVFFSYYMTANYQDLKVCVRTILRMYDLQIVKWLWELKGLELFPQFYDISLHLLMTAMRPSGTHYLNCLPPDCREHCTYDYFWLSKIRYINKDY